MCAFRRIAAGTLLLGCCMLPSSTLAQGRNSVPTPVEQREAARQLYLAGTEQVDSGDYRLAVETYRRSFELYPSPSTLANMAHCESRLGHFVEAWSLLSRALATAPEGGPTLSSQRRSLVQAERDRLAARIPSLIYQGPDGLDLLIEGTTLVPVAEADSTYRTVPASEAAWSALPTGSRIRLDPGNYRISLRWNGEISSQELELREGTILPLAVPPARARALQTRASAIEPARQDKRAGPPPLAESRPFRTAAAASLVGMGVAFTTALISAGVLLNAEAALDDGCSQNHVCPRKLEATVSRYETAAVVTNVALMAGVATGAAGIGFFIADRARGEVEVRLQAAGPRAELRVSF